MSMTGETNPDNKRQARRRPWRRLPRRRKRCAIQAAASPPSTANGGSTNTKWRMPLYMAGRAATVTRIGSAAASTSGEKRSAAARTGRIALAVAQSDNGCADRPAKPERQHQFGQLQREQRRHVAARHVGHRDQLAVEQFAPRLFEKIREIFDGVKGVQRGNHAPRPDQAHDEIGKDRGGNERDKKQSAFGERRALIRSRAIGLRG